MSNGKKYISSRWLWLQFSMFKIIFLGKIVQTTKKKQMKQEEKTNSNNNRKNYEGTKIY